VVSLGRVGEWGVDTVKLPNGVVVDLEVLHHPGAAAVVPMHDDGSITLIRQYRHAAGGMIWELPAGKLEPGEDPALCAARELTEETGLVAGSLRHLSTIHTTPGFTDERIWIYAATNLTEAPAAPEHDEVIERHCFTADELRRMLKTGEVTDGKTICGLMLALLA
jgi:ADP-ribose pyrophosphatase